MMVRSARLYAADRPNESRLLIITAMGTPPGEQGARDPFLRMHAVNVYVRDQERSLRFYIDTLGFQVAFDAQVESGQRMVAVTPPDGSTVLTLIQPQPHSLQVRR